MVIGDCRGSNQVILDFIKRCYILFIRSFKFITKRNVISVCLSVKCTFNLRITYLIYESLLEFIEMFSGYDLG